MHGCESAQNIELPFGGLIELTGGYPVGYQPHDTEGNGNSIGRGYAPQRKTSEEARDVLFSETTETDGDGDEDMSPLQYARRYGLTTNYFDEDPLRAACIPSPPRSVLSENDTIEPGKHDVNTVTQQCRNERWDLHKETAELLTAVMAMGVTVDSDADDSFAKMQDLKITEPVLSSDPEYDLSRLKARNAVRMSTNGLQPCGLDTERGESLAFPTADVASPSAVNRMIAVEKPDIDRETAEMLCAVMKAPKLDLWDALELAVESDKSRNVRRSTPPLLPLSPPLSPLKAYTKVHEMDFTSTPEDLFAPERAQVEAQLFAEDRIPHRIDSSSRTLGQATSDDIEEFTKAPVTSSSSPLRQKRLRDLRTETPLLPHETESSPAKRAKTVSFPEEVHTLIPPPEYDDCMTDLGRASHEVDDFIHNFVAPLAEEVIDQVGNEKLDELDTTLRAIAPAMVDVELCPPWSAISSDDIGMINPNNNGLLLLRAEKELSSAQRKWPGLSKLDKLLPWTPFPSYLGRLSTDEQFDDGSCERYMANLTLDGGDGCVEPLLWKAEGMRLLDAHDNDDEELESSGIGGEDQMEEDVEYEDHSRQRPSPMQAATLQHAQDSHRQQHQCPAVDQLQTAVLRTTVPQLAHASNRPEGRPSTGPKRMKTESLGVGMQALLERRKLEIEATSTKAYDACQSAGSLQDHPICNQTGECSTFSFAENGLNGFLGLQGAPVLASRPPKRQYEPLPATTAFETTDCRPEEIEVRQPCCPLPNPAIQGKEQVRLVVVSSSMLANRQLVRELQALLPNLDLIERDPTSLAPLPAKTCGACEADFTLSASAGLICTTLQKLKQKPLPGQRDFYGVRDRIAAVSVRYESCVVLVSEGRQDDTLPAMFLDDRDTSAINELIGFAHSLESTVEVRYVAGGDAEVAKWIAANICRYAGGPDETKLLHDETMWERLLRVAGANPAAAQMILARLKRVEAVEPSEISFADYDTDSAPYGLPAFVKMSKSERIQQFRPWMGGDHVLARVSDSLEGLWPSATRR